MALITLQDYKDYYSISSTTGDNRLQLLVDLVSELVESYCGRKILSATYTAVRDENFSGFVYLDNFPITEVTTLEYYSDGLLDWVVVPSASFDIQSEEGVLEILDPYVTAEISSSRSKPIRTTYVGGFFDTPADLKLAIFDLVTYYNKREQTPSKSFNGQSLDANGTFSGSEMPAHIKRVLSLYRVRD